MKTYLFIDGTNLYASQYELFGPQRYLNFPKFIKEVEKKIKVKFNKIYFYASYSPKPKRINKKTPECMHPGRVDIILTLLYLFVNS